MQQEIIKRLQEQLNPETLEVTEDGGHYHVMIVSEAFNGLLPVKRQQTVYAAINELITTGLVHAVHIKAKTPAEYQG